MDLPVKLARTLPMFAFESEGTDFKPFEIMLALYCSSMVMDHPSLGCLHRAPVKKRFVLYESRENQNADPGRQPSDSELACRGIWAPCFSRRRAYSVAGLVASQVSPPLR